MHELLLHPPRGGEYHHLCRHGNLAINPGLRDSKEAIFDRRYRLIENAE
jgi:hypothetical protein